MKECSKGFNQTANGTLDDWKTCLERGANTIGFECCLDEIHQIQHMRSVQGHSGGERLDPRLQIKVLILHGWSDHIHHVGSSYDYCDPVVATNSLPSSS